MSLTYITAPTGIVFNTSGIHHLEEGVTVDANGFDYVLFYNGAIHTSVLIDGTAIGQTGEPVISLRTASDSQIVVGETGSVQGQNYYATYVSGNGNQILNYGSVSGAIGLYSTGDANSIVNHGDVVATGSLSEITGISRASGGAGVGGSVENTGRVLSDSNGIVTGVANPQVYNSVKVIAESLAVGMFYGGALYNSGLLKSADLGVLFDDDGGVLRNSGKIKTEGTAVNAAGTSTIINDGLIASSGRKVIEAFGAINLVNTGKIKSLVNLSDEDDTYLGRGDGVVKGSVLGVGGSDTMIGSRAEDIFNGGNDDDTLKGRVGDDSLVGGFGADILNGGRGKDKLWGGPGARPDGDIDTFQFLERKMGTDRIMDFVNGSDLVQLHDQFLVGDLSSTLAGALSTNADGDAVVNLAQLGTYKGKIIFEGVDISQIDTTDFQILFWAAGGAARHFSTYIYWRRL